MLQEVVQIMETGTTIIEKNNTGCSYIMALKFNPRQNKLPLIEFRFLTPDVGIGLTTGSCV